MRLPDNPIHIHQPGGYRETFAFLSMLTITLYTFSPKEPLVGVTWSSAFGQEPTLRIYSSALVNLRI
jgi:hypothetical protein